MDGLWSPGRQKRAHEVVLSVDEKTSILALQRTQLPLPLRSGRAVRHTHDYKRHEVVDLYAALEIATGRVTHRVTESHTPAEVRRYPKQERRGRLGRVRSQVITIMAPEDEAAFLGFVFERPTVYLIPDVRNPTPEVPRTRDIREHKSLHCMLWDKAILPQLRIEHIPSCSDYYLRSDESLQDWKLKHNGPPEYSLHYFDPSEEDSVLARYRAPKNFIGVGRVAHVGDVVSTTMRKQVFRVAMEKGAPVSDFEGPFMCTKPEPRVGDEVACVFNENICGRHSEPWEPREIKKLTPANKDRVLEGLRKAWRL